MHIVFYGPEGSGKGTQADLLSQKLKVPHLVSGDLVRKYAKEDKGIIGDICRDTLNKGTYIPDSAMYIMWKHRLKEADTKNGWIIDGFPRNLTQAKFLARKVEKYGQELDIIFYLKVSQEESIKRLTKRGRKNPDGVLHDSLELIKERLKHYNKEKEKVLEYYQHREILQEIDGERSVEAIHADIQNRVHKLKQPK